MFRRKSERREDSGLTRSKRAFWEAVRRFLVEEHTASVATVDERGGVHAANVWVAADGRLRLYFFSDPRSAHARHIQARPRVAVTVGRSTGDPMAICGLQIHGVCRVIAPPPKGERRLWQRGLRVYRKRFPQLTAWGMFSQLMQGQYLFCVEPRWVRWLDNSRGFGFKVERVIKRRRRGGRR